MLNLVLALAQRKASCISGDVLVGKSVLINVSVSYFIQHFYIVLFQSTCHNVAQFVLTCAYQIFIF